jgi:lysyl-tRNA synthetase class 2
MAAGRAARVNDSAQWRPSASLAALRRRAQALAATRDFFKAREVLEVDTPAMVNAPVSDVNIGSVRVEVPGGPGAAMYLHTSPEYAMKRLLAAGSGDIFQVCHVFRGAERGRQHNPEFTMVEWYRLGFSLEQLMDEVARLVRDLLGRELPVEYISYRDALRRHAGLDPFGDEAPLRRAAQALGLDAARAREAGRDELLDLVVGAQVGPALGAESLTFLHRYPASQAALARLDPDDPRQALRFELYYRGVELANGYHELANAAEQRMRFNADLQARRARGLPASSPDAFLLAALESGLPDCAGVALGFDRVLMLAEGAGSIDEILPFPVERA